MLWLLLCTLHICLQTMDLQVTLTPCQTAYWERQSCFPLSPPSFSAWIQSLAPQTLPSNSQLKHYRGIHLDSPRSFLFPPLIERERLIGQSSCGLSMNDRRHSPMAGLVSCATLLWRWNDSWLTWALRKLGLPFVCGGLRQVSVWQTSRCKAFINHVCMNAGWPAVEERQALWAVWFLRRVRPAPTWCCEGAVRRREDKALSRRKLLRMADTPFPPCYRCGRGELEVQSGALCFYNSY